MSSCHPLPKLLVCLVWVAAACIVFDPVFLAGIIASCVVVLVVLEGVRPWAVLLASVPFALVGFGFLTNAVLFRADDGFIATLAQEAPMGGEAVHAGATLFLRAMACGMISYVFARTTSPGDLTRALMAAHLLPARFGYALFAVFNLAPSLAGDIRLARIARAMRKGRAPRRVVRPQEAAALSIPLLAGAIRQASLTAIAMEARGLGRTSRPALINVPRYGVADAVFITVSTAVLCLLIAAGQSA